MWNTTASGIASRVRSSLALSDLRRQRHRQRSIGFQYPTGNRTDTPPGTALLGFIPCRFARRNLNVSFSLVPRDPESERRQRELDTIVHSQLGPRVVEMGPNGGRGYAEPLSQFSVGETFRRKQPKHLRLARRKLAQHDGSAPFRFPSSGGGHHLRSPPAPKHGYLRQDEAASATGRSGTL